MEHVTRLTQQQSLDSNRGVPISRPSVFPPVASLLVHSEPSVLRIRYGGYISVCIHMQIHIPI